MANKKSAEKRIRQNVKRKLRNKMIKSEVKTFIKKFLVDVKANNKEAATESFKTVEKLVDSAARKGIYHKNNAARKKSRYHKLLNNIQ